MRQVTPARFVSLPPIIGFSILIFFVALADGIVSYTVPIAMENGLGDPALVGIVLSISSFFGIALDFFIAQRLSHKGYRYFLPKAFIFAALFLAIFLFLPPKFMFFCIAMLIWAVYYEFVGYSKYNFVQKYVRLKDHTNAWGTLSSFSSLAYMLGPGIAAFLIYKFANLPFYVALGLVVFTTIIYSQFEKSISTRHQERVLASDEKRNVLKEIEVLKTLMRKLWVMVMFTFALTLVDVLMWTVGVLYSEEIRRTSPLGDWVLVIYGLPALFTGSLAKRLSLDMGKKRMSFTTAAIAGICLIFAGMGKNTYSILIFIFLMATFCGVSFVFLDATFQDYITRAKAAGNDVISLLLFAVNMSYSFGPIILGVAAKYLGYERTFELVGWATLLVSLFCFFVAPRKIKLPQKEIQIEISEISGINTKGLGKVRG